MLLTYMYRQAFSNLDFGYGSAIAVVLTVIVFILSVIQPGSSGRQGSHECTSTP